MMVVWSGLCRDGGSVCRQIGWDGVAADICVRCVLCVCIMVAEHSEISSMIRVELRSGEGDSDEVVVDGIEIPE